MALTMRRPDREDDFLRVRGFLREVLDANGGRQLSWHVARWDYWRWHVVENCAACDPLPEVTFIWESADGGIVAVLNPENGGEAHLQIHPRHHTPELEAAMLDVAEARLSRPDADGRSCLQAYAHQGDGGRQALLAARGYLPVDRSGCAEHQRSLDLAGAGAAAPVPAGYVVRSLGDEDELPARSWVSWRAFHPDAPDSAYEGWQWYRNIRRAPLYRRELDIVAVATDARATPRAPTGEMAAFCTAWYDDVTRTALFEPVGTAPEHRRRGLGRAVLAEAAGRLRLLGCRQAHVSGYSAAANALYAAAGFTDCDVYEPWLKRW
jgi:mycothiol synthase